MKIAFYIFVFVFGFSRFLPFPNAPDSVHDFFSSYGFILHGLSFIVLVVFGIVIIFRDRKSTGFKKTAVIWSSVMVVFIVGTLSTSFLIDLDNQLIIYLNDGRSANELTNPILGRKLKVSNNCLNPPGPFPRRIYSDISECDGFNVAVFSGHGFFVTYQLTYCETKVDCVLRKDLSLKRKSIQYRNSWNFVESVDSISIVGQM